MHLQNSRKTHSLPSFRLPTILTSILCLAFGVSACSGGESNSTEGEEMASAGAAGSGGATSTLGSSEGTGTAGTAQTAEVGSGGQSQASQTSTTQQQGAPQDGTTTGSETTTNPSPSGIETDSSSETQQPTDNEETTTPTDPETETGGEETGEEPAPQVGNAACSFDVSAEISDAISTVGIVNWTTDLQGLTGAHIDFWPDSGSRLVAPAAVDGNGARTLLLGMKSDQTYTYQIVAEAGDQVCTSQEYTLETGLIPSAVPFLTRDVSDAEAMAPGFIIATMGLGNGGPGGGGGGGNYVVILDTDGEVVWWAESPGSTSRARMDWEGNNMWMLSVNVGNTGGANMRRVSMDGLDVESNIPALSDFHHDFAVVPGGVIAGMSWVSDGRDPPSDLVEYSPDGTLTTITTLDSSIYNSDTYHSNAIHYHPTDEAYTISDRNPNLYVKVSRTGELLWQLGGNNPVGPVLSGTDTSWAVNHGHHFTEDNHFLIFNNNGMGGGGGGPGGGGNSLVLEYLIDESAMTAELIWQYDGGEGSPTLGDVQRLPNGNTLVTYSNSGIIQEVDSNSNVVQTITNVSSFGYVQHRPSLYGTPPKSR